MTTVFSMIIDGKIPGSFVWKDDRCVAFLSINPGSPGHTLVVPRAEVDHWIDLDADLNAHLLAVSQKIGQVQQAIYQPARIGLMIVGEEVPHVHLHVIPMRTLGDLDLGAAARNSATPDELAANADRILEGLRGAGHDPGV